MTFRGRAITVEGCGNDVIALVGAGVLAVAWEEAALAIIGGGLAGAIVSSLLGPYVATRQARIETFRSWQAELAGDFVLKLAAVRNALKELGLNPGDNATKTKASGLIEDLDVLAQRVELVFERKRGAPDAAKEVIEVARNAPADTKLDLLGEARDAFVEKASDEIRGR